MPNGGRNVLHCSQKFIRRCKKLNKVDEIQWSQLQVTAAASCCIWNISFLFTLLNTLSIIALRSVMKNIRNITHNREIYARQCIFYILGLICVITLRVVFKYSQPSERTLHSCWAKTRFPFTDEIFHLL